MLRKIIKNLAERSGYKIIRKDRSLEFNGIPVDMVEKDFLEIFSKCKNHTFTSVEPMYSLYQSVKYIAANNIPGDLVECGVWKGGSAMLMIETLLREGITDRKIYLYDTFEGMSEPTAKDIDFKGDIAETLLNNSDKFSEKSVWCYSSLDEVKANLFTTDYPKENIVFVKGKVEETIPKMIPGSISLLRLDTDWYESTYHELVHLFPVLSIQGVLIIDDYGHWKGSREATDKYFMENNIQLLMNRIDYAVRTGIKNK